MPVLLLLVLVGTLPACAAVRNFFDNPIVVNQGPAVLRDSTALFTQVALVKKQATVEEAQLVKKYIEDAEGMLAGQPPATALDQVAAYLNSKIENAFVRSAIQQGILLLKNQISLPEGSTYLTPEQLVWVKAVLDGGKAGCDAYIAGAAVSAGGVTISAPDVINFRDTRTRVPNDGWIDFRR